LFADIQTTTKLWLSTIWFCMCWTGNKAPSTRVRKHFIE